VRYRIVVAYRGSAYAGWQRQDNAPSVQEVVEAALRAVSGEDLHVVGASRTDAGVHARGQVAHVDLARELPPPALVEGANHHLPEDVRVLDAAPVAPGFHARRSAVAKEYRYRLSGARVISPLDAPFCAPLPHDADRDRMVRVAPRIEGRHDFSAFAKSGGSHTQPFRRILLSRFEIDGDQILYRIVGEGFLRGMVRALVGTLIEVGRGRRTEDDLLRLLQGGSRSDAGANAPAQGLVLERVFYLGDPLPEAPGSARAV